MSQMPLSLSSPWVKQIQNRYYLLDGALWLADLADTNQSINVVAVVAVVVLIVFHFRGRWEFDVSSPVRLSVAPF
jgi:hypothetical protein